MRDVPGGVNRETDDAVYFYTPKFYVFDNFSAFTVPVWGRVFPTGEHAFQWKKFSTTNPELAEEIFRAGNPHAVKGISDAHKSESDPHWQEIKVGVMEEIVRAKLEAHEKVRTVLLETGEKEIVENSPIDSFWGSGPDGAGQNMLGQIWMKLRAELRA